MPIPGGTVRLGDRASPKTDSETTLLARGLTNFSKYLLQGRKPTPASLKIQVEGRVS